MRKTKRIKIDDVEITVFELRVKDIRALIDQGESLSIGALPGILPMACDLPPDKFADLAPSEIQMLWDAFSEVNAVFFDWTAKAGIGNLLKEMIRKHWTEAFADVSKPGTPPPQSTVIPFLSSPSKNPERPKPTG